MKTTRIGLVTLLGAALGFVLQGCFAAQPPPECTISDAQNADYVVKLTRTDTTGCANHLPALTIGGKEVLAMELGAQRYHAPGTKDFSIAYKPAALIDMVDPGIFTAYIDPSNDCSAAADLGCDLCVTTDSTRTADGGYMLGLTNSDGTIVAGTAVVGCTDGTYVFDDASGDPCATTANAVDLTNVCEAHLDLVPRSDSADPTGKNLVGKAKIPQFPNKDAICVATDFTGATQTLDAVDLDIAGFGLDAGTLHLDSTVVKYEWANFNIYNTTKVPSTAFKGSLTYTEGSCVAKYDALGVWPMRLCDTDADCDPEMNPDAGPKFGGLVLGFTGSGINPFFKPKCDVDLGVCLPSVDVATLK